MSIKTQSCSISCTKKKRILFLPVQNRSHQSTFQSVNPFNFSAALSAPLNEIIPRRQPFLPLGRSTLSFFGPAKVHQKSNHISTAPKIRVTLSVLYIYGSNHRAMFLGHFFLRGRLSHPDFIQLFDFPSRTNNASFLYLVQEQLTFQVS